MENTVQSIIGDYLIPVTTIAILSIIGLIGYRYLKLRKKYDGRIPDEKKFDIWDLK